MSKKNILVGGRRGQLFKWRIPDPEKDKNWMVIASGSAPEITAEYYQSLTRCYHTKKNTQQKRGKGKT